MLGDATVRRRLGAGRAGADDQVGARARVHAGGGARRAGRRWRQGSAPCGSAPPRPRWPPPSTAGSWRRGANTRRCPRSSRRGSGRCWSTRPGRPGVWRRATSSSSRRPGASTATTPRFTRAAWIGGSRRPMLVERPRSAPGRAGAKPRRRCGPGRPAAAAFEAARAAIEAGDVGYTQGRRARQCARHRVPAALGRGPHHQPQPKRAAGRSSRAWCFTSSPPCARRRSAAPSA